MEFPITLIFTKKPISNIESICGDSKVKEYDINANKETGDLVFHICYRLVKEYEQKKFNLIYRATDVGKKIIMLKIAIDDGVILRIKNQKQWEFIESSFLISKENEYAKKNLKTISQKYVELDAEMQNNDGKIYSTNLIKIINQVSTSILAVEKIDNEIKKYYEHKIKA